MTYQYFYLSMLLSQIQPIPDTTMPISNIEAASECRRIAGELLQLAERFEAAAAPKYRVHVIAPDGTQRDLVVPLIDGKLIIPVAPATIPTQ